MAAAIRSRRPIGIKAALDSSRGARPQPVTKSSIAAWSLRSTTGSPGAPSSASSASAIRPVAPKLPARLLRREAAILPIGVAAGAAHQVGLAGGAFEEGGAKLGEQFGVAADGGGERGIEGAGIVDHVGIP